MLVALFGACQSEDATQSVPAKAEIKVDTTFHRVTVDRLRMRNSPGLSSDAITLLPEGVIVRYWGEHSRKKRESRYEVKLLRTIGSMSAMPISTVGFLEAH